MDMKMGVGYEEDQVDGMLPSERVGNLSESDSQTPSVETTNKMAGDISPYRVKNTTHQVNCTDILPQNRMNGHINKNSGVPATVTQTARDLAFDIVYSVSKLKKRKPSSKHASTLRRTVEEMSSKHEILFSGMMKKLQIDQENAFIIFTNVANEIFKDKQYNWGRVVSVYAFGARMAKHVADSDRTQIKLVEKIADFVGKHVAEKLGVWINEQGGWDAFDEHFPEQLNIENVMWKGLLVTAFGLGALATVVAVR